MVIVHIISGLRVGGAERMLHRLLLEMRNQRGYERQIVLSLTDMGPVGQALTADGVEVHALGLASLARLPKVFSRLRRLLVEIKPDVVQTWLYHSDLLGGLASRSCGIRRVFWGIHSTQLNIGVPLGTRLIRRLCALLSYWVPEAAVCVAESARKIHVRSGYCPSRLVVIPNGFLLPDMGLRAALREATRRQLWGSEEVLVIGSVGRFNADKDPGSFVAAAAILARSEPMARFLMLGKGLDSSNPELVQWIAATGCPERFKVIGEQADVLPFLFAMDSFCLHSATEAFPLVLGEAMAAGVPCVTTDVGDAKVLLGTPEWVVPPAEPAQMAAVLGRLLAMSENERNALGLAGRARVESTYGMEKMCANYMRLYDGGDVASGKVATIR